jgi:hypothetical protein
LLVGGAGYIFPLSDRPSSRLTKGGDGSVRKPLRVEELSEGEIEDLLSDEKYKLFGPVQCTHCGHKGRFRRRIYRIYGTHDLQDDDVQDAFRLYMYRHQGLKNIFFRTIADRGYIDTAFCDECSSNMVVFDLFLTDEATERLFEKVGSP